MQKLALIRLTVSKKTHFENDDDGRTRTTLTMAIALLTQSNRAKI